MASPLEKATKRLARRRRQFDAIRDPKGLTRPGSMRKKGK